MSDVGKLPGDVKRKIITHLIQQDGLRGLRNISETSKTLSGVVYTMPKKQQVAGASVGTNHLVVWTKGSQKHTAVLFVSGDIGLRGWRGHLGDWEDTRKLTWADFLNTELDDDYVLDDHIVGASAGKAVTAAWTNKGKLWVFGLLQCAVEADLRPCLIELLHAYAPTTTEKFVVGAYATTEGHVFFWTHQGELYRWGESGIELLDAWATILNAQKIVGMSEVLCEGKWPRLLAWTETGGLFMQKGMGGVYSIGHHLQEHLVEGEQIVGASGMFPRVVAWTNFGNLIVLSQGLLNDFKTSGYRVVLPQGEDEEVQVKHACGDYWVFIVILTVTGRLYLWSDSIRNGPWQWKRMVLPPAQSKTLDMPAFVGISCRDGKIAAWTESGDLYTFNVNESEYGDMPYLRSPFGPLPYNEGQRGKYVSWAAGEPA